MVVISFSLRVETMLIAQVKKQLAKDLGLPNLDLLETAVGEEALASKGDSS